jgi:outer membrane protein assembly factor BamB
MRRRIAVLLTAMLILTTLALPGPSATRTAAQDDGGDVPMFRGNAARTGEMPGPGPELAELRWKYETGTVRSSPTVVNGIAFVASYGGNVYALDAASGRELWRVATGGPVFSSPAVVNGVVFIGSYDGSFVAFDASTGSERWRFATGGPIFSSPAAVDEVVYFGSEDGIFYALDTATGRERWRVAVGGLVFSSPAVVDSVVYVGNEIGSLLALDAVTGSELWRFAAGRGFSSPAVDNGVVYVGSYDNNVYALDAATGQERWRVATGDWVRSSPAVADGVVYVGSYDNNVYAFDAGTGRERWHVATGDWVWSSPAVAEGEVYVGSYDGKLYAFDADTGRQLWDLETGDSVFSSPTLVNGVVYVGSNDGFIYAIGRTAEERAARDATATVSVVSEQATSTSIAAPTATHEALISPWRNYFWNVGYNLEWLSANNPDYPVGLEIRAEDIGEMAVSPNDDGSWSCFYLAPGFDLETMVLNGIGLTVFPSADAAREATDDFIEKQVRSGFKTVSTDRIEGDSTCMTYADQDGVTGTCYVLRGRVLIVGLSSLPTDAPEAVLMKAADLAQMGILATRDLALPE